MKITDKKEFVAAVTDGLSAPPQYFFKDAMINKKGYESIDSVLERNVKALNVEQTENEIEAGALVIDTRNVEEFIKGFVPGSIFIGLDGTYAVWVGTLIDIATPLVVVAADGKEREAILRLARVGYENVRGYLEGGVAAWQKAGNPIDTLASVDPEIFADDVKHHKTNSTVLDVRRPGEWNNGHVKDAEHLCLTAFTSDENISKLNKETPYYLHCQSGYRSVIAASILKQKGFTKLTNVRGGWSKISKLDLPLEMPVLA